MTGYLSLTSCNPSSLKGKKYVVLHTYPAELSAVCASELVAFSDLKKAVVCFRSGFASGSIRVLG